MLHRHGTKSTIEEKFFRHCGDQNMQKRKEFWWLVTSWHCWEGHNSDALGVREKDQQCRTTDSTQVLRVTSAHSLLWSHHFLFHQNNLDFVCVIQGHELVKNDSHEIHCLVSFPWRTMTTGSSEGSTIYWNPCPWIKKSVSFSKSF